MLIRDILEQIKNTAGSNDKRAILEANRTPLLEQIFTDTYDKSRNYYVKKYNKDYNGPSELFDGFIDVEPLTIDNDYHIFHELLNMLNERHFTGNEAIAQVEDTIAMFVHEDRNVLHTIMDRNLKIGIAGESFNKSAENEINKFEVALAYNLDKVKGVDPIDGTYFASRKLDGIRCICTYYADTKEVDFWSRQGKKLTSLDHLKEPVRTFISNSVYDNEENVVLDGELCSVDENGNEDFSGAVKKVTKKDTVAIGIRYCVFDMMSLDVFETGEGGKQFSERYDDYTQAYYNSMYDDSVKDSITVLQQERLIDQEGFDKWSEMVKDNGWEGFMLRKNAPYKSGRCKDLIKVKKFQDAEYVVEGVVNGTACYNEDGMKEYDIVSALLIRHKGNVVRVGSGLSKEQRLRWYSHPDEIIGKTVTIQYFEETQDSKTKEYSLRFPVLKYVYENGRDC